jgi:hypothetical protein
MTEDTKLADQIDLLRIELAFADADAEWLIGLFSLMLFLGGEE